MIVPVIAQDGFPGLPASADPGIPHPPAGEDPPPPDTEETAAAGSVRNQPAIWDAEPEPRQLPLIPDPAAWESDRPAVAVAPSERGGRLARRRRRTAAPSTGQLSLF